ncbi:MAG: cadherin-like beta sandwich domain-containing protein [Pseudomonadota bacterium]
MSRRACHLSLSFIFITLVLSAAACSEGGSAPNDQDPKCPANQQLCGDGCVDTQTDRLHCGGCAGQGGEACPAGEVCSSGACSLSCGGSTPTLCDERCVDTQTDRLHCGGCAGQGGEACPAGEVCSAGACQPTCMPPLIACGTPGAETCIDPKTNHSYCGARGTCQGTDAGRACSSPAELCMNSQCVSDEASLVALEVSAGTLSPAFSSETTSYVVTVFSWVNALTVVPTAAAAAETITVDGSQVLSGSPSAAFQLKPDPIAIDIVVQAPSGRQQTYVLVVLRSENTRRYTKASNTNADDVFGVTVSISGDTLAVGAAGEASSAKGINGNQDDNSAPSSGAVYVLRRSGATWTQEAYIKASNTEASDNFGCSVSISGDTLAVGASAEDGKAGQADNLATNSGAVYIFRRSGTTWTQEAYLKPSNAEASDYFGHRVSLAGDTLAVGAYGEDSAATGVWGDGADNSAQSSGAVYVFRRSGSTWTQEAYIKASNTEAQDFFGSSVSLSGNTLAVGAYGEDSSAKGIDGNPDDDSSQGSGAVYIFRRSGTTWTQEAYVKASNTAASDEFGHSVSLSEDSLAVGAPFEDSSAKGVGGSEADNGAGNSGAVYVFRRNGAVWAQEAYVKASNTQASDHFGQSVSLAGNALAIGAEGEDSAATAVNGNQDDNAATDSGAVYVFRHNGTAWAQEAYVKATNTETTDEFGFSLCLSEETLAVGSRLEDSAAKGFDGNQADNTATDSGAVYVFR